MEITKLRLANFRNYVEETVFFSDKINYIEGENGTGKSSLLEAIYLLSTGKSFRTKRLFELISYTKPGFQLEAEFIKEKISHKIKVLFNQEGRKLFYNDTSYTSFLPLLGLLPCVLLSSEDISLFKGGPAERRRFLDLHIAQIDPLYLHHLGRYERALKQRNHLLKHQEIKGLLPWEELMAISAEYLIKKRKELLQSLTPPCNKMISYLSQERESFHLEYINSLEEQNIGNGSSSFYREQWEKSRLKEIKLGLTIVGPHRDDILFFLQGKEVKSYASEGQKRCCIAALRLAEWETLKELLFQPPLFCIDDFGVHLDAKRSHLLNNLLDQMGQVFLTAPKFDTPQKTHVLQRTL
jgi:DNA replication and repair protein RecF